MLIILSVFRGDPGLLLNAARFTTGHVRLVGQEPPLSKCGPVEYIQGCWERYEGLGTVTGRG